MGADILVVAYGSDKKCGFGEHGVEILVDGGDESFYLLLSLYRG